MAQSALSNAQSSVQASAITATFQETYLAPIVKTIGTLSTVASAHPFYKYSGFWSRLMQDAVSLSY